MESDHSQIVEELFKQAVDRKPTERALLLSERCGSDAVLRAEVESLLAHHDATGGVLDRGLRPLATAGGSSFLPAEPEARDRPLPARIGAYRIVDVLGEGGMGVVYRAEQDRPQRIVALKLIRPGFVSEHLLRRFEHEAQVLGRLQHPGIAQIHEAGTADTGSGPQPYFAMELVQGQPLIPCANQRNLGTRQRLELLAKVCDAVHHAHQKGVIHRDLKPGNILVQSASEESGRPAQRSDVGQPKILDFGVARSVDSDVRATTLHTEVGQLIGTVQYMSPEQCSADPNDVDSRCDVYALGVMGYELLTGRLPYDLQQKPLPEAVRIIREQEPTPLGSMNRLLRGDVETMVAKALEKDRNRRYQSASEFAVDLRRYLRDEPILARPTGGLYRLRKFARRNKVLVGSTAVVLILLISGLVATTWQARRAMSEAEKASRLLEFHRSILASVGPEQAEGRDTALLREVLDQAAHRAEAELADQPEVEAAVLDTIGTTHLGLGLLDEAERHLSAALGIARRVLGNDHPQTLATMTNLASLLQDQGRVSEAEPLYRQALDTFRRKLGAQHPDTLMPLNNLGTLLIDVGRFAEAESVLRESLAARDRLLGPDHRETLDSLNNLAFALQSQSNLLEAEPLYRRALESRRRILGNDHPDTLGSLNNLSTLLNDQEEFSEAEPLLRQLLAGCRKVFGEEHPHTLIAMNNLAGAVQKLNNLEEAESLNLQVLDIRMHTLGEQHPHTLASMNNLATVLHKEGKDIEAEPWHLRAFEGARKGLSESHPNTLAFQLNYGKYLTDVDRYDEAEVQLRGAYTGLLSALGDHHATTLNALQALIRLYDAWGKPADAEKYRAELNAAGLAPTTAGEDQ